METSPNMNSRIFNVSGVRVLPAHVTAGMHFGTSSEAEAAGCGLASSLLSLPTVTAVFVGPTWLSVNCVDGADWDIVGEAVQSTVARASESGPVLFEPTDGATASAGLEDADYDSEDEDVVRDILDVLDEMVRPTLQADGGDIVFLGYRDGHVRVRLAGSCEGCAQSTQTLQVGVQRMLQHYVTDVDTVEAVENTPMDMASNEAFEALERRLAAEKGGGASA
ncbi:hypothetical protein FNF27_07524 [Cafeteria roenbergensis]|uniref:Scaffold protein Nfu/NifU N-terminal domain-containing protein n=1 Tax=Cafeteria roenbergensis TaxID=33653 RepID=A0A5A8DLV4_CAFRO|nr:hypothetical protein FNF27_07524 [Cafeteria roenbergensis]